MRKYGTVYYMCVPPPRLVKTVCMLYYFNAWIQTK